MILAAGIIYSQEYLESLFGPTSPRTYFYSYLTAFLIILFVVVGMYCEKKLKKMQKEEQKKDSQDNKICDRDKK